MKKLKGIYRNFSQRSRDSGRRVLKSTAYKRRLKVFLAGETTTCSERRFHILDTYTKSKVSSCGLVSVRGVKLERQSQWMTTSYRIRQRQKNKQNDILVKRSTYGFRL